MREFSKDFYSDSYKIDLKTVSVNNFKIFDEETRKLTNIPESEKENGLDCDSCKNTNFVHCKCHWHSLHFFSFPPFSSCQDVIF